MTDRARTGFQALVDLWRVQSDGTLDLERGRLLNRCADALSALLVQPEPASVQIPRYGIRFKHNDLGSYFDGWNQETLGDWVKWSDVAALLVQEAPQEEEKTDHARVEPSAPCVEAAGSTASSIKEK